MIAFLLLLLSLPAQATTFGPFPLVGQIENSPFVARGRASHMRVELQRDTRQPATYWDFQVLEQMRGEAMGSSVAIRQPGGEVGDSGYYVAGTANFRDGEEVLLMLRGTAEPSVYDVVGLMAGKYTVEDGGKRLVNALGFPATNAHGKPLTLPEFRELVERVNSGNTTAEDKAILLNNSRRNQHAEESEPLPPPLTQARTSDVKAKPSGNSVQPHTEATEESSKGHKVGSWIFFLGGGILLSAVWVFFRRKK